MIEIPERLKDVTLDHAVIANITDSDDNILGNKWIVALCSEETYKLSRCLDERMESVRVGVVHCPKKEWQIAVMRATCLLAQESIFYSHIHIIMN